MTMSSKRSFQLLMSSNQELNISVSFNFVLITLLYFYVTATLNKYLFIRLHKICKYRIYKIIIGTLMVLEFNT